MAVRSFAGAPPHEVSADGNLPEATRSLTEVLPGELLVKIMDFALNSFKADRDRYTYSRQLRLLGAIDSRSRRALHMSLGRDFRGIAAAQPSSAANGGQLAWPWVPIPSAQEDYPYWAHVNGQDWNDKVPLQLSLAWLGAAPTTSLQRIAIDLRLEETSYARRILYFGDQQHYWACEALHGPHWVMTTNIINRLAYSAFPRLDTVHIRLSPQQNQIDMVFQFIKDQRHLRRVNVEVDSLDHFVPSKCPVLDLRNMTLIGSHPVPLRQLVIRGPRCELIGWDHPDVFARLDGAQEVRLSALRTAFTVQPCEAVIGLLRVTQAANVVEFGTVYAQHPAGAVPTVDTDDYLPTYCPNLVDLTLQFPGVDARFLRQLRAPNLRALRIRCGDDFGAHGEVPANHFPHLAFFRSACSTPVESRVRIVGLVDGTLVSPEARAFRPGDNGDFTVYIRPDIEDWIDVSVRSRMPSPSKDKTPSGTRPRNWLSFSRVTTALFLSPAAKAKREALIKTHRKLLDTNSGIAAGPSRSPMRAFMDATMEELAEVRARATALVSHMETDLHDSDVGGSPSG